MTEASPKSCELCNSQEDPKIIYKHKGIVGCPKCELVFFESRMLPENLYDSGYFHGGEYLDYVADKKIIQHNFLKRITDLRVLKPSGGRLLEIGCAYGFFLELAQKYWEVEGIDVAKEATDYARNTLNLNVRSGDFLTEAERENSFDIVCMWDVVEHLVHPVEVIKKAARALRPGGILVLTTGDIGSLVAQSRKSRWRMIHPPSHLYYFDKKTLHKAVVDAGLREIGFKHVGYSRSYKSMMFGLFAWNKPKTRWIYQLLTLGGRLDFPIYLNLFDIAMITAQKA